MRVKFINYVLLIFVSCFLLFSCSLDAYSATKVSKEDVESRLARAIDQNIDEILPFLEDEDTALAKSIKGVSGKDIVERALSEEKGREYIDFSYEVVNQDDVDNVIRASKELVSEEDYEYIVQTANQEKMQARAIFEKEAKYMTLNQQKEFYADLQKMVVKAVVLLTAAIVYACIPKIVLWGKITAACAIAVAAGILASSVMSVVGYYKFNEKEFPSFQDWIKTCYEDSYASWAVAASMIATCTAAKRSPLVTGLILAAFTLFNVLKDIQPILKKYNFS